MMAHARVLTERDGWILPLAGLPVTRCIVDYAFSLHFWTSSEADYTVRIGGPFVLQAYNQVLNLSARNGAVSLGPALRLFGQTLESAVVAKNGELTLRFGDRSAIVVPPESAYEAWEVAGPSGLLVVCQAGGKLAIWQPKDGEPSAS